MDLLTDEMIEKIFRKTQLYVEFAKIDDLLSVNLYMEPIYFFRNLNNLKGLSYEQLKSLFSEEAKKYLYTPRLVTTITGENFEGDLYDQKFGDLSNLKNVHKIINLNKAFWIDGFSHETFEEFDQYPKCSMCTYENGTYIKKERIKTLFGDLIPNDKNLIFGKGYGKFLMNKFIKRMKKKRYTSLVLEPLPIGNKDYTNKVSDLKRYYLSLGFKQYENFMYMNI